MRRAFGIGATIALIFTSVMIWTAGSALADPSAASWAALRQCESSDNYSINTGNGYFGAYQFDQSTWLSVGGTGSPSNASPAEQDYRALYLYRMRGWSPWTCATLAGLQEDSSARSGVVPTRAEAAYIGSGGSGGFSPVRDNTCNVGTSTPPAWGGTVFKEGTSYGALVCWQKQAGYRGLGLDGTGHFGSQTLWVAHQLQNRYGIAQSDVIDRATWNAAWGVRPTVVTTPVTNPPVKAAPVRLWPGNTAATCHVGAKTAPAWPGKWFTMGASDRDLACWQMEMGHRGYDLIGNGTYGPHTLAAAKDIQNRNHLGGTGLIGENTWRAAWEGAAKG